MAVNRTLITLLSGRYLYCRTADGAGQRVAGLAALGILVGMAALVVVLSVMNGFQQQLRRCILQHVPQIIIAPVQGSLNPQQYPKTALKPLPGQQAVVSLTTAEVVLQSDRGISSAKLLGIDPQAPEPLAEQLLQGRLQVLQPQHWRVILGVQLARQLGVQLGDSVRLIATQTRQFTPLGPWPSQRLFTVAGLFMVGSSVDSDYLLVHQQDAARLLRYPNGHISGWRLLLKDPLQLPNQPPNLPSGLVWRDWRQNYGMLFQAVNIEKRMMTLLLSLIIAIGCFNILTALSMQVLARTREIAILQTLGVTRWTLVWVFMIQGATRALLGSFLGLGLGIGLASYLNPISERLQLPLAALPVEIQLRQLVFLLLATFVVTLLATFYPAWQAAGLEPIEGLQHAE
ncbi:MAG: FtsX-like permease family protein [Candidatus Symbiodolus clandestinus]